MAWGWYIPLGLLGLMLLTLFLRVKVGFAYDQSVRLWLGLGPVKVTLLPKKPGGQEQKTKKQKTAKKPKQKKAQEPAPARRKLTLDEILAYVRFGLDTLGRTAHCLRVDELTLHAVVGTEDAAQTALAYGAASAALSGLYPAIERKMRVHRHDLSLEADFTGQASVKGSIQISAMVLFMGINTLRVLIGFLKLRKQHTGKAVTT